MIFVDGLPLPIVYILCANSFVLRVINVQLFALGYGIRIEDVQKKDAIRSITGERDYF